MPADVWFGLAGSLLIAGAAYWKRSLSASGFAAAVGMGTLMYAWGTIGWFGTLIAFFVSSTLWSKWKKKRKSEAEQGYEKTGRRDAAQVLANGGIGLALCGLNAWSPSPLWWYAFIGVMAAVNADTWATEIGGTSRKPPRHIWTGRIVTPGTSGGITARGLLASAAGGLFIGGAAGLLAHLSAAGAAAAADADATAAGGIALALMLGLAGGLLGSLADSALGASVQAVRRCARCGREVERREHCGSPALPLRGWPWMNNDLVNAVSSLFGGAVALLLGLLAAG